MIAIGGEDPGETLATIAQQQEAVDRELVQVPQRAQELGPDFLSQAGSALERLMAVFNRYSGWLAATKTALEESETSDMMELHEQSHDLLPELTKALSDYHQAYAGFGPFESALCNTMWRLTEGLEKKTTTLDTWKEYTAFYQSELSTKLLTLNQLELPGRTPLFDGYGESLKNLQKLMQIESPTCEAVRSDLKRLDKALAPTEILESVIATSQANGTTKIPATNTLLYVLRKAQDELGEDLVLAVLDDYNETVEGFLDTFERAVARPTHSDLVREEIPRTLDTLDGHFLLIEDLNDILEGDETDALEELLQKIEQSADRLIESRDVYETAALHQSYKACPSCGRSNPPENRSCEACGEMMPRPDKTGRMPSSTFNLMSGPISEQTQTAEMTENVARLFQSCDDVNDGKISKQQFADELRRAAAALTEFIEEYENQVNLALDESLFSPSEWENWRTNHLPHLEDQAISYYAGIEDLKAGLASMEVYFSEPDKAHLIEGIRLYWQGIQAIHRGKLAIQSHTKLLDDLLKESEG